MIDAREKALSKALFGNAYMLSVIVAIAQFEDGTFSQRGIASRLGVADNLVTRPLSQLKSADLIKERSGHWESEKSVFWDSIKKLYAERIGTGSWQ